MYFVLCFVSRNLQHYERSTFPNYDAALKFVEKVVTSKINTVRLGYIVAYKNSPFTDEEYKQVRNNDDFDIYE